MTSLPAAPGIGFKPEHFAAIRETRPALGFLEIHAENYMGAGGPPHRQLAALRQDYALSIHGVGLSIGGPGRLDRDHLARLRALLDRYRPESFSEHLAWSSHGAEYLNDLLPLPYTPETLRLEVYHEGLSLQILHIGSYDDEGPILARLHTVVMLEKKMDFNGPHHEIYLGDPRKTEPSKLRTILRQPVKAVAPA